jgi:hypothetical protein
LTASFDVIVPFAIYMLSPLKIKSTVALAWGFSVGTLYIDHFFKSGIDPITLQVATTAQVIVNVLGLLFALQLQTYRRKSFQAYIDEKDAKEMVAYLANIDPLTKSLTWSYLIRHLQNQGDAMSPNFVFQFGVDNPLNQVFTEGICSYPAFIDIDADLDYDVFITDGNGNIDFYENVGDQSAPVFELDSVHNVLGHVSLSEATKIVFHDVSGDGLQDAVISHGVNAPELLYFENTGTAQNPVFEQRTGVGNPFDGITDMEALVPVFADIDDDGDDDLILGTWGRVLLYEAVQISDVSDITGQRGHRVYPNPSSGMITASGEGVDVVEAMDESGRVIRRSTTKWNTITMDLTGEAPGFYFVRMIGSAGVTVRKIILL